jgi:hypothetical protein
MSGSNRFGLDELGPTEGREPEYAMDAVRALELAAEEVPAGTGAAFSDRVMAAIADEPLPGTVGFLSPLRRRGVLAGFADSVRQAWASIWTPRPTFARAAALAYVLVVALAGASLVGAVSIGAAGALGLLEPHQTVAPTPTPTPTPAPIVAPPPTVLPSPEPEPSETPEVVEPTDDHGGGSGGEPSDDHGGSSGSGGSGGSDDGSGSSGGDSTPSSTDEHSGSDDGGSGGGGSGSGEATQSPDGGGSGGSLDD